jgi:surface antigen
MDRTDQACIAHALELAGTRQRVSWQSADNRATYILTPGDGFKRDRQTCREFSLRRTAGPHSDTTPGRACRTGDGTWKIVS